MNVNSGNTKDEMRTWANNDNTYNFINLKLHYIIFNYINNDVT